MFNINKYLLKYIKEELDTVTALIESDNILGLNVTLDEIMSYLEFSSNKDVLDIEISKSILITEGDILSIIKIIDKLVNNNGEYILYINDDNIGIISYLVSRANLLYKENNIEVYLKLDYSDNYNNYLNDDVLLIGSEEFINTAKNDFNNYSTIIV